MAVTDGLGDRHGRGSGRSKRARAREGDLPGWEFCVHCFRLYYTMGLGYADRSKRMERDRDRSTIDGIYIGQPNDIYMAAMPTWLRTP
jgi:hypothetical protein